MNFFGPYTDYIVFAYGISLGALALLLGYVLFVRRRLAKRLRLVTGEPEQSDASKKRRDGRLFFWMPIIGFVVLGGVFAVALSGEDGSAVGGNVGFTPDFAYSSLEYEEKGNLVPGFSSQDLADRDFVVLNVFASWCLSCRREHHQLTKLQNGGVVLFGVNYRDQEQLARQFLLKYGNEYDAIASDKNGKIGIELGLYGVPTTIVFQRGTVVRRYAGELTDSAVSEIIFMVSQDKALGSF